MNAAILLLLLANSFDNGPTPPSDNQIQFESAGFLQFEDGSNVQFEN